MIELQVILVSQTRNLRFQSAFSLLAKKGNPLLCLMARSAATTAAIAAAAVTAAAAEIAGEGEDVEVAGAAALESIAAAAAVAAPAAAAASSGSGAAAGETAATLAALLHAVKVIGEAQATSSARIDALQQQPVQPAAAAAAAVDHVPRAAPFDFFAGGGYQDGDAETRSAAGGFVIRQVDVEEIDSSFLNLPLSKASRCELLIHHNTVTRTSSAQDYVARVRTWLTTANPSAAEFTQVLDELSIMLAGIYDPAGVRLDIISQAALHGHDDSWKETASTACFTGQSTIPFFSSQVHAFSRNVDAAKQGVAFRSIVSPTVPRAAPPTVPPPRGAPGGAPGARPTGGGVPRGAPRGGGAPGAGGATNI